MKGQKTEANRRHALGKKDQLNRAVVTVYRDVGAHPIMIDRTSASPVHAQDKHNRLGLTDSPNNPPASGNLSQTPRVGIYVLWVNGRSSTLRFRTEGA